MARRTPAPDPEKYPSQLAGATRYARQLFLHGAGDGKPITRIDKLAEASGCNPLTIHRYLPAWTLEREKLLASATPLGLSMFLTSETLKKNEDDVRTLRETMDELKGVLKGVDKVHDLVERFIEAFEGDLDSHGEALELLDRYLKTIAARRETVKHFLEVQRRWKECVGIDHAMEAAGTKEKELAKGKARMEIAAWQRAGGEDMPDAKPAPGGVFRRSAG